MLRAFEESGSGLVLTNYDGRILRVSPKILALTGYEERDLIGSTPRAFRSGQTPNEVYKDLWSTIKHGQTWSGAILNRRKDGILFLDRETIFQIKIPRDDRPGFLAVHRNSSMEMELRLTLSKTEVDLCDAVGKYEEAKESMEKLVCLTGHQVEATANSLVAAMEAKDRFTIGHSRRTAYLMEVVGSDLGLFPSLSPDIIRIGAILHDIGKVGVPDSILHKQGRLTDPEFAVIKSHPAIGFEILRLAIRQEEILRIVRHHHERLDGSGYPDGLKGDELPDYVKVFSVCDCYEAMTSDRAYRRAMSPADAISILTDEALVGRVELSAVKSLKRLQKHGALEELHEMKKAA